MIHKDVDGGVESSFVRRTRLQELLVEATKAINETDALAVAHSHALERLEKSGLVVRNDTKHLHASVVSGFTNLTWKVGLSKLHVGVSLRTVRADDPDLEAWKPVELADVADKSYVRILLRAFHARWKELGWDDQVQANWLWEKEYQGHGAPLGFDEELITYGVQCLRICVFKGTVVSGDPETYSFLTFNGPDGEPI